mgnify:CR=1 FL=1
MGCSASKDAVTATPKTDVAWNNDGTDKIQGGETNTEIKEGAPRNSAPITGFEAVPLAKVGDIATNLNTDKNYCVMNIVNPSAETFF